MIFYSFETGIKYWKQYILVSLTNDGHVCGSGAGAEVICQRESVPPSVRAHREWDLKEHLVVVNLHVNSVAWLHGHTIDGPLSLGLGRGLDRDGKVDPLSCTDH